MKWFIANWFKPGTVPADHLTAEEMMKMHMLFGDGWGKMTVIGSVKELLRRIPC